jgi:putative transposase
MRDERLALVGRSESEFSIKVQAELLGLNRASLYYQPAPPSDQEVAVKHSSTLVEC